MNTSTLYLIRANENSCELAEEGVEVEEQQDAIVVAYNSQPKVGMGLEYTGGNKDKALADTEEVFDEKGHKVSRTVPALKAEVLECFEEADAAESDMQKERRYAEEGEEEGAFYYK